MSRTARHDHPIEIRRAAEVSAEELAVRARDGSRVSFDELVVRYRPRLVAFLARRLADAADAEDVAQETFVRVYDHLDRYDPARPFSTWLFAIGKNVAANHAIARTRRDARELDSRPGRRRGRTTPPPRATSGSAPRRCCRPDCLPGAVAALRAGR